MRERLVTGTMTVRFGTIANAIVGLCVPPWPGQSGTSRKIGGILPVLRSYFS